jgi:primase-polymerase (primpol)-like protein
MKEQEPAPRPYERVPEELKGHAQWVNWNPQSGRKVPLNPVTLGNASVSRPDTWTPFAQAAERAARYRLGVGFVLSVDDPYTCVDLDRCVGETREATEQARAILDLLAGWVELSPSGSGLHVWVRNEQPVNRRTQGIEVYASARWITITGRSHPHAPQEIPDRTGEIQELVYRYFPRVERAFVRPTVSLADDKEIWQQLFHARNGAFFESLFHGDVSVCYGDPSRAVILLANQLALFTDLDATRVKRLLYQTGLVRPKWEERRGTITWIDYQIEDAIRFVTGRVR